MQKDDFQSKMPSDGRISEGEGTLGTVSEGSGQGSSQVAAAPHPLALPLHEFLQGKYPFGGIAGVGTSNRGELVVFHSSPGLLSHNPPTEFRGMPVVYRICPPRIAEPGPDSGGMDVAFFAV